jgi:hypothetical protein
LLEQFAINGALNNKEPLLSTIGHQAENGERVEPYPGFALRRLTMHQAASLAGRFGFDPNAPTADTRADLSVSVRQLLRPEGEGQLVDGASESKRYISDHNPWPCCLPA